MKKELEDYNVNTKVGIKRIDKLFNSVVIPFRYREEKAFKDGIDGLKYELKQALAFKDGIDGLKYELKQALADKVEEIKIREKNRKEFLKEHLEQQDDAYAMLSKLDKIEESIKDRLWHINESIEYHKHLIKLNEQTYEDKNNSRYMVSQLNIEKNNLIKIQQILKEEK